MPVDAPERRAEVAGSPLFRTVEPERAGGVRSQQRSLVQRDERDDALGAAGKRHLLAPDFDAEPRQQVQDDLLGGTVTTPSNIGGRPQG